MPWQTIVKSSMDVLNFEVGLHASLGVAISESDHPKLDGCVESLAAQVT